MSNSKMRESRESEMVKAFFKLDKQNMLLIKSNMDILYARQLMDSGKRAG